ncbi:MAG TPA: 3-phosphoshikimate 1-carboxyvinyltransferase, partial [Phnomibacter sp.]|nr:3-phosphoshikimate 1-carboxyvinyltransferase [Phnomibacter sp.]
MMQVSIQPGKVAGTVTANASKSAMQRACAAALLRQGLTYIHNPGNSNDDQAALDIIQKLGATITPQPDGSLLITGTGHHIMLQEAENSIHCGESGLSIRMFTPIAALSQQPVTITGHGSLTTRPMDFFVDILPQLGVSVQSNDGKLPLRIQGPLTPKDIVVDGSLSSQFLTGLLMAYAALPSHTCTIQVQNLKSKPYIDLTLQLIEKFGLRVPENRNYEAFVFAQPAVTVAEAPLDYTIEGDWSGAAFLLVAAAIAGNINLLEVFNTSRQADKRIIDALLDAGAEVKVLANSVQ